MVPRIPRFTPFVVPAVLAVALLTCGARAEPIRLAVDAREAARRIVHVRETVPVAGGRMDLSYPRWIPGEHGPTGPIADLAGLRFAAGDRTLTWRRDDVDMYRVHVDVPPGVRSIEASFDFLGYAGENGYSGAASFTEKLALLSWNEMVLYPSGARSDEVEVEASLQVPAGWSSATALPARGHGGGRLEFAPVPLTMLVDSPVLAGQYLRTIDLGSPGGAPVFLDLAADGSDALDMDARQINHYRALAREALALFGARHYRSYRFLVSASDHVAHFGLEHHECSDDRVRERTFVDPELRAAAAGLLPHEYVHSWNGKYRRPAGLATGDYQTPMKGELLWVYEGLTQYLGFVLGARAGVRSPAEAREELATLAARLDARPGRTWRPLEDTAIEAQILYQSQDEGQSWRRSTDFYDEGLLLWLEADVRIRQLTNGRRSLDDFCRRFHGGRSGPPAVLPYTFEDVVRALNETAAWDWRGFLEERLHSLSPHAPLGGIENGGWRIAWADSAGPLQHAEDESRQRVTEWYSIGINLASKDGRVEDVLPGSPAARAGVAPGVTLVAVDGRAWSREVLEDAIGATAHGRPLELLVRNGEYFSTHRLDWRGGARFPRLERERSKPDVLDRILAPLTRGG